MDGIRKVGAMLCACSLLSMLFSYLLPKTGLSNAVKGCAGVFFTAAILYAAMSCSFDLQMDFDALVMQRQQDITREAEKKTLQLTENAVSDQLYQTLRKGGMRVEKTKVYLHIAADGCIEISKITVTGANAADVVAICQTVRSEYGISPEVRLKEDGGI